MPEITLKLGETVVQKFTFDKDVISIGRSKENDIVIETLSVSRNHARIRRENGGSFILDLESANGTYVNGVKVAKADLLDGDRITVGKHDLIYAEKTLSEEQFIGEAFGADRTMLIDLSPTGVLLVLQGKQKNQEFVIDRYETLIGRAENCHVRLFDWFVSKRHAVIRRDGEKFVIRDFGKLTGVQVNNQTIHEAHTLVDGDEVKVGPVLLKFMVRAAQPAARPSGRIPHELPFEAASAKMEDVYDLEGEGMVALSSRVDEEDNAESAPVARAEEAVVTMEPPQSAEELNMALDSEPVSDVELSVSSEEPSEVVVQDEIVEPMAEAELIEESVSSPATPDTSGSGLAVLDSPNPGPAEDVSPEVAIWEKALANPSRVIRQEAARKLKKLTGRDYDV